MGQFALTDLLVQAARRAENEIEIAKSHLRMLLKSYRHMNRVVLGLPR